MIKVSAHQKHQSAKESRGPRLRYGPWEFMMRLDSILHDPVEVERVLHRRRIVNLAAGVNFLPPPPGLLGELARALQHPLFYQLYDGYQGHIVSRRALAAGERLRSSGRVDVTDDEVLVTGGAGTALNILCGYLADNYHDAEALVPVPTFPLIGAELANAGIRVHEVRREAPDERFLPDVSDFAAHRTRQTCCLYINIFNNPTGECYSDDELKGIFAWANQEHLAVIVDQTSAELAGGAVAPRILEIAEACAHREKTFVVSSISKERSMPGLRVGWLIGPAAAVRELARQCALVSMSSPTLAAALLFVDMLCRSACSDSDGNGVGRPSVQLAQDFRDEVLALAPLATDVRAFLEPYADATYLNHLVSEFHAWRADRRLVLTTNWKVLQDSGGEDIETRTWQGDLNTFVRVPAFDETDHYEAVIMLFRRWGIQLVPGPVFGFTPREWRRLGFWTRLSFGMDTDQWSAGLGRLIEAIQQWEK